MWLALAVSLVAAGVYLAIATHNNVHREHPERPLAPEFALVDLDGKRLTLVGLRGKVVIIDFWATWCGPCRMIAPVLDQLSIEYAGKAKVAKLDVDTNIRTPARFQVRSIPAILFFKNGKLVRTLRPEKRVYKSGEGQPTSEVALYSTPREDLYVVFAGMSNDGQRYEITAHVNPLVFWVWAGGGLMFLGTLITLLPDRRLGFAGAALTTGEAAAVAETAKPV